MPGSTRPGPRLRPQPSGGDMAALDARAGGYRTVIDSAEHLLGVLPKGQARIDIAVEDLCRAVDSLDAAADPIGRHGFEAAPGGAAEPAVTPDAALNQAAAEARIAQILFAASAAVGEEKDDPGADVLGDVVSAARSDVVVPPPSAQRFDAADASISVPEAVKKLRQETNEALDRLVIECERTTTG